MGRVTIISDIPPQVGWGPILHAQRMMVRLFNASIHDIYGKPSSRLQAVFDRCSPRKRSSGEHAVIYIARSGFSARNFVQAAKILGGSSRSIIWMIDSFWTNASTLEKRLIQRHFDYVAYTQSFDAEFYEQLFGRRALCLEWGSDVLSLGGTDLPRDIDVLRLGRQPASWENDAETERACAARGLIFAGRSFLADATSHSELMWRCQRAKFVIAHSNVAAPAPYTHPTKAYITGRWTDALACGASVAGMPPDGDLQLLDWPGALLKVPCHDRNEGLDLIASAAACWTPSVARRNHLGALRRLDWRWRLQKLARAMEIHAPLLDQEIHALQQRIVSLTSAIERN